MLRSIILLIFLFAGLSSAGQVIERLGLSRVGSAAWGCCNLSTFGKPIETFRGRQYLVFYDNLGNVCVARRALPDTLWDTLRVGGYTTVTTDGHNVPVLGISPVDGTLHLAFDHHNDPLHYSVSVKGLAFQPDSFKWTGLLFGPVRSSSVMPGLDVVCYPHFMTRPDSVLQFICRLNGGSPDANWGLWEYNALSSTWSSVGLFLSKIGTYVSPAGDTSRTRCAYPNGYTYRSGRLHVTWCWRELLSGNTNHDLMYAYSDDFGRTWRGTAGDLVGTTATDPMKVGTSGIKVWDIQVNRGYINQVCQNVDSRGQIHAVTWHVRDGSTDDPNYYPAAGWYFHYWRDTGGTWHRDSLFPIQQRCKLLFDDSDNAYLAVAAASVYRASAASNWTDWQPVISENIAWGAGEDQEPILDFSRWQTSRVLSIVSGNMAVLDYAVSDSAWPVVRVEARSTADSAALAGAAAGFYRSDTLVRGALTGLSGNGTLRLKPGVYDLRAAKAGFGAGGAAGVTVSASPDTQVVCVYLDRLARIGLRVSPSALSLAQDDSARLSVNVVYADGSESSCGTPVEWHSLSPLVAQVDTAGRVTSFSVPGTAWIVCSGGGFSDSVPVTVRLNRVLSAVEDAYVRDGSYAALNYGNDVNLYVKDEGPDLNRQAFLKFDVSSLGDTAVEEARLRLYWTGASANMMVTVFETDNSWSESAITWNSRPAAGAPLDTARMTSVNTYMEWDVTPWFAAHAGADTVSFCLKDVINCCMISLFNSSEAAGNRPMLVVVTDDVPPVDTRKPVAPVIRAFTASPNPFNPAIKITLPVSSGLSRADRTLQIFFADGRLAADLSSGAREKDEVRWRADRLPSGVYVIRFCENKRLRVLRTVLMK